VDLRERATTSGGAVAAKGPVVGRRVGNGRVHAVEREDAAP
jgi:hypothetical protein